MTSVEPYRGELATNPSTLQAWSDEAIAAANFAATIAATPFVPASLRVLDHVDRGRPDLGATTANITAALLTGQELGLSPMASLRSIDIVQGTPALRAIALRALVLQAGHDMWVEESTKTRAVVKGRRANSDKVQESVWTLDRAKDLGLTGRDNWRKQPGAMLVARASAELARLIAADAILGLPYIAEELEDGDQPDLDVPLETAAPAKRRTAQRRLKAAPTVPETPPQAQDEPPTDEPPPAPRESASAGRRPRDIVDVSPPDDEPPTDDITAPAPGTITDAQSKMMHGLFRQLGINNRDDRLAMSEGYVGHALTTSNELTVAEASLVIDELNRLPFDESEADGA